MDIRIRLSKVSLKEGVYIFFVICIICMLEFQIGRMVVYKDVFYQQADAMSYLYDVQNYQTDGRIYKMTGEDPQLLFQVTISCIDTVRIEFAEPVETDMTCTIYYDDGSGLNEGNSVGEIIECGAEDVRLSLPQGKYQYLRMDIDGNFSLREIFFEGNMEVLNYVKLFFYVILCMLCNLTLWLFRGTILRIWNSLCERKRNYVIVLAFTCILMALFYHSFYWPDETFIKRKIAVISLVCLGIAILPIVTVRNEKLNQKITKYRNIFWDAIKDTKRFIRLIVGVIGNILVVFVVSKLLANILGFITDKGYNHYLFYFIFITIILIILVIKLRYVAEKKPEIIFFVVIMLVGMLMIRVSPAIVGISWDDEIHYNRAISLSNYLNGVFYASDKKIIDEYQPNIIEHKYFDRITQEQYYEELQSLYDRREYTVYENINAGIYSVAYIPSAIGIVLARGLGLNWVYTFMMGRFFNLLMYAILIYYAIKKVLYGKLLIAAIGLIPTSVFMACSYSYDPWVIGFIILGYAHFFSVIQKQEGKFEIRDIITIVSLVVIGCMPKAVYFPLLLPLFFISKSRFSGLRRGKYYGVVLVGILFLLFSFILPILLNGAGTGDVRGGADVNSALQIQFILQHPMQYTKILLKFLRDYTTIENFQQYFQSFAYMGQGKYYGLCTLVLVVTAFIDKGGKNVSERLLYPSVYFACFSALVFVATALYVSFTAVAADTVAGCQYRYMTPVLFLCLYCIGSNKVKYFGNKVVLVYVPILIMAGLIMNNIFTFCVMPY